jgi:hypothetical protein
MIVECREEDAVWGSDSDRKTNREKDGIIEHAAFNHS